MGFNSAFKGLKIVKKNPRERAFKQFKWPRPQCVKERRGYSHLKEEALNRTMWRARFGRGFGPVVRQTAK